MGELQTEYETTVEFNVIPAEETLQRTDEIKSFGFEAQLHGLVVFDSNGEALVKLPGHNFGKEEIRAAIQKALPQT